MKKIILTLSVALALIVAGTTEASAQRQSNGRSNRIEYKGNNGNHNGNRPQVGNNGNHNGNRPQVGNNGNHNGNRPQVGNNGNRPGVAPNRPNIGNNGNHNGNRPQVAPPRPGNNVAPGRPAQRPVQVIPPQRPHRPVMARPVSRPLPPPAWRPRPGVPVIHGILGLTFGVAINASLDYLFNSGYSVDGYANNVVYLRNVPALNYVWTDGALYYGNGGLDASSFYYSTPVYDMSRYNNVYRSLVATYGVPVSSTNVNGLVTSTWFGGNNGYVTLSFGAGTGGRFLTTLTLGM